MESLYNGKLRIQIKMKILKINSKIIFWGFMGCLKLLILPFLGGFGALKIRPQVFSFLILAFYYFIWILSFLMTPTFLFYNDFEGYYDTLKKMFAFLEKICILYSKICPKSNIDGLCAFGENSSLNLKKIILAII